MKRVAARLLILLASVGLSALLSSCSTVIASSQKIGPSQNRQPSARQDSFWYTASDSAQRFPILSSPREAEVVIYTEDGQLLQRGRTPMIAFLSRNFGYFQRPEYRIVMEKPGFERKIYYVRGRLNYTWYLGGNFLFGGLIGYLLVDPWSGAMWTLSPEEVNAVLLPTPGALPEPSPAPALEPIPLRPQPHPTNPTPAAAQPL
jgi:hypothetical protein